jgi:hypothetical protein
MTVPFGWLIAGGIFIIILKKPTKLWGYRHRIAYLSVQCTKIAG